MLNIVFLPDLHIGAPRLAPEQVYVNLQKYVYPQLQNCQLLILGGDLYDALLNLDGAPGLYAHMFIRHLRHYAKTHKFFIRAIRGTFTHDRNQLQHLLVEDDRKIPAFHDKVPMVQLYDDIAVEKLEPLGLTLLYLPDDLPYSDLLAEAKKRMHAVGLKTVDIIVHHGYCTHLLPHNIPRIPPNTYTVEEYQKLYHGVMLNGHVHFKNITKNCISGGSFERFCHGEEESKGFFIIHYDPATHRSTYDFIENTGATLFKTFRLYTKDPDGFEAFKQQVDTYLQQQDQELDVHLRVEIDDASFRSWVQTWVLTTHPKVHLTVKLAKDSDPAPVEDVTLEHSDLPVLTPSNLLAHALQFLQQHKIELTEAQVAEVYEPLLPPTKSGEPHDPVSADAGSSS